MVEALNQDLLDLKARLGEAWRRLADPSLTSFERREIRNYMKDANIALRAGLKRLTTREQARREAYNVGVPKQSLEFRIIRLDA